MNAFNYRILISTKGGNVQETIMIFLAALLLSFPKSGPALDGTNPISSQTPADQKRSKVVVGYILDGDDTLKVAETVDFVKITHLNVAFSNPTSSVGDLSVPPHLHQLVALAHKNNVKILISIGGGYASEDKTQRDRYFALIGDPNRPAFVAKLDKYVSENQLDGVDVDLEGEAVGKDYGAFVGDLYKVLKSHGKLITAAVSSGNGGPQISADALACFDLVNVMAYDATGPWNPNVPGQHSSMDLAKECTTYWLGRGVPKSRLVLGVPFYGWGFGTAFTQGGYSFADLVSKYPGAQWVDQEGSTIWYNGIPTIKAKVKFVLDQGLAGVMIWELSQDSVGKNSLLTAIHEALSAK